MPLIRRFDDARTKKLREWYNDDSLVYLSDTSYFPELQPDKESLSRWMRQAGVFTQEEIRTALDYDSEYDASRVLVPSGYVPLNDLLDSGLQTSNDVNDLR